MECLKVLIENGVPPWCVDEEGKGLLHVAAERGCGKCLEYLISLQNCPVNMLTADGSKVNIYFWNTFSLFFC